MGREAQLLKVELLAGEETKALEIGRSDAGRDGGSESR